MVFLINQQKYSGLGVEINDIIVNSIAELVGNTPVVKFNRMVDDDSADVYVKLEYMNPGSSVKDRIALAMIEAAEKDGKLKAGRHYYRADKW